MMQKAPPRSYRPAKSAPRERLAYLSRAEMELLRRATDGRINRGPHGIPSFYMEGSTDTGTVEGNWTSGGGELAKGDFGGMDNGGNVSMSGAPAASGTAAPAAGVSGSAGGDLSAAIGAAVAGAVANAIAGAGAGAGGSGNSTDINKSQETAGQTPANQIEYKSPSLPGIGGTGGNYAIGSSAYGGLGMPNAGANGSVPAGIADPLPGVGAYNNPLSNFALGSSAMGRLTTPAGAFGSVPGGMANPLPGVEAYNNPLIGGAPGGGAGASAGASGSTGIRGDDLVQNAFNNAPSPNFFGGPSTAANAVARAMMNRNTTNVNMQQQTAGQTPYNQVEFKSPGLPPGVDPSSFNDYGRLGSPDLTQGAYNSAMGLDPTGASGTMGGLPGMNPSGTMSQWGGLPDMGQPQQDYSQPPSQAGNAPWEGYNPQQGYARNPVQGYSKNPSQEAYYRIGGGTDNNITWPPEPKKDGKDTVTEDKKKKKNRYQYSFDPWAQLHWDYPQYFTITPPKPGIVNS
jgi:hypothetical protein